MTLHSCTRCGGPWWEGAMVLRTGLQEWLCAACWKATGRPESFHPPETVEQVHRGEEAARRAMLNRGGKDAYMVRAGKT